MTLIERNIGGVGRLQIGGERSLIAFRESVLEQGRAESLTLIRRIDADHRKVPVRLLDVVAVHLLEDRDDFLQNWARQAALKHGLDVLAVDMNSRR
jgi:pyrimidine operon attenuation protein/uracil phosphoribosyltransferase